MNYLKKVSEDNKVENEKSKEIDITEISSFYKNSLIQLKQWHQQTYSNSLHLHLEKFYIDLEKLEDLLTECLQGCYSKRIGIIENYKFEEYKEDFLLKHLSLIKDNTSKYREILKKENGLVNILDDIETLVLKAMFTFTLK